MNFLTIDQFIFTFPIIYYFQTNKENGDIDFDQLREMALEHKPKIILAGFSAYPKELDYQKFVDKVAKISEEENHHPDISFGWGYAKIIIMTHAIEGLSENDFILAAKVDQIFNV